MVGGCSLGRTHSHIKECGLTLPILTNRRFCTIVGLSSWDYDYSIIKEVYLFQGVCVILGYELIPPYACTCIAHDDVYKFRGKNFGIHSIDHYFLKLLKRLFVRKECTCTCYGRQIGARVDIQISFQCSILIP
jgi:hypothetical protein